MVSCLFNRTSLIPKIFTFNLFISSFISASLLCALTFLHSMFRFAYPRQKLDVGPVSPAYIKFRTERGVKSWAQTDTLNAFRYLIYFSHHYFLGNLQQWFTVAFF